MGQPHRFRIERREFVGGYARTVAVEAAHPTDAIDMMERMIEMEDRRDNGPRPLGTDVPAQTRDNT